MNTMNSTALGQTVAGSRLGQIANNTDVPRMRPLLEEIHRLEMAINGLTSQVSEHIENLNSVLVVDDGKTGSAIPRVDPVCESPVNRHLCDLLNNVNLLSAQLSSVRFRLVA